MYLFLVLFIALVFSLIITVIEIQLNPSSFEIVEAK